jgi:hypothetical protein
MAVVPIVSPIFFVSQQQLNNVMLVPWPAGDIVKGKENLESGALGGFESQLY